MKTKRIFSMMLVGITAMGLLAGCSLDGANSQDSTAKTAAQTETEAETQDSSAAQTTAENDGSDADAGLGNVLVVYYSATGNTEAVANTIADVTGGDLFEVEPAEPYTDEDLNWSDENSRVSREHEDESLRDVELVSTQVDQWDSYDTVFIGYPIWWGIAAWPLDTFVENNDFTGKTVIPFCTSSSSDIGESGQLLADLAGTGDWQKGMRFRSSADEADIQAWVDGLGL